MKELEMKIYGRVQGVNFRRTVQKHALQEQLRGYVLNRIDGSVDIVAQGDEKALQTFLAWVQSSPGLSRVQGLHYQWRKPSQVFGTFELIRSSSFVTDQAKSLFNLGKSLLHRKSVPAPKHVAIIPDGNRRWARAKGVAPQMGHYSASSFQHMNELFDEAQRHGVQYLTFWGFSTENWKRSSTEVNAIFDLILRWVEQFSQEAHTRHISFRHLGRKDRLPAHLLAALSRLEEETRTYETFHVQLCLDYGGSDELVRAINHLLAEKVTSIDEKALLAHLDSASLPPIDLIIRTSGEQRLSGFMPLQAAYAELYFSPVHFPDFTAREFKKALTIFQERQRRFGG